MAFSNDFINGCIEALGTINISDIEKIAETIASIRNMDGRLFIIGSGGGAGHASHAICDFRKLCNIEAYAPYDNVSELTARVNDEGWDSTILNWLKVSRLNQNDCVLVFSVGGGDAERNISNNVVLALKYAKELGAKITGIVGKDGGYTKKVGDAVVVVPIININPLYFQLLL